MIKKSEQKKLLVKKLEQLHKELDIEKLYIHPSHKTVKDWIANTAAILKNLDESDYQEFARLSKTITPTEPNRNKRKSAAYEIDALIRRKVAEYKVYDFSYLDKENIGHRLKKSLSDTLLPKLTNTQTISAKASIIGIEKTSNKITISRESKEPVLQVKEIAEEIAKIIINLKSRDGIIGIFGKWGRGKTYLMEQIWNDLKLDETHTFNRVNFQAWLYQDTPACWAYLYEKFAEAYLGNSWILKQYKILRLNFHRISGRPLLKFLVTLTPLIIWKFTPFIQKINLLIYITSFLGIVVLLDLIFLYFKNKERAINLIKTYTASFTFKPQLGFQAEVQKELVALLNTWIGEKDKNNKQVVLFVEDIDRCCEEKIIQIIDSLRVMLENPDIKNRVVVLAAIDQEVLKRAILWKYKDLFKVNGDKNKLNDLVVEYMDKLFILGINLCPLSTNERKEIFETYTPIKEDINLRALNKQKTVNFKVKTMFIDKNQDKFLEISEIEKQVFSLKFDTQTDLLDTPREINIVYYQYLLARNLLIKLGVFSFKEKNLNYSLILELIMLFKKYRKADGEKNKENLMQTIDRKIESSFNELKKQRQIKGIVELVVAY